MNPEEYTAQVERLAAALEVEREKSRRFRAVLVRFFEDKKGAFRGPRSATEKELFQLMVDLGG